MWKSLIGGPARVLADTDRLVADGVPLDAVPGTPGFLEAAARWVTVDAATRQIPLFARAGSPVALPPPEALGLPG